MKFPFLLFLVVAQLFVAQSKMLTPYEKGNGNQTVTYKEMVDFYAELDEKFETVTVEKFGQDDNGEPIRVVVFEVQKGKSKETILINNGIHPGEPDGIDATMMLFRDLADGKISSKNIRVVAIQAYNISGMLRRGKFSRANQNGPEEYGFRGNARNYDLNRDFIKSDTENTKSFHQIFHHYKPVYFIDNHVSNGADYQYLFTYISTNKERTGRVLGDYFHNVMQPQILKRVEKKGILATPYVNVHGDSPDNGFPAFMDSPRYATGYTTLFNIPGTVAETHMLKKYSDRVHATYVYMVNSLNFLNANFSELRKKVEENKSLYRTGNFYPLKWKIDSSQFKMLDFKGFEAGNKTSRISGKPRLYYDRNKPFVKKVKYFDSYKAEKWVKIPSYYVVSQSERKTIDILKINQIEMKPLVKDTAISVQVYKISDFKTTKNPYEGHYYHYDIRVESHVEKINFRKGDYLINTSQDGVKFLLETLEPEATDSFFAWNFFDGILGQKEYFSDYVFEDTAADLLATDSDLKERFEDKKASDAQFSANAEAQLEWLYRNSPYYEGTVNRYTIFRIE